MPEENKLTYESFVAKFLINDYRGILKKYGYDIKSTPIPAWLLSPLLKANYEQVISRQQLRNFLTKVLKACQDSKCEQIKGVEFKVVD